MNLYAVYVKGKVVPPHVMKVEWRFSATHSNLSTRWRQVVSIIFRCFTPMETAPQYPLNRTLGESQCQSGSLREQTDL
jgi:hypothetical protein